MNYTVVVTIMITISCNWIIRSVKEEIRRK
jgi:hypothetical protein